MRIQNNLDFILTPDAPCHLLVCGEGNRGRSILFQILHWIKSRSLNHVRRGDYGGEFANINTSIRQWRKPTLETNKQNTAETEMSSCTNNMVLNLELKLKLFGVLDLRASLL